MYLDLLRVGVSEALGRKPNMRCLDSMLASLRRKAVNGEKVSAPLQGRLLRGDMRRLRRLQEKRLRATLRYVFEYVPFYRRQFRAAGLWGDDIRHFQDLKRLAPTRKKHLQEEPQSFLSRHGDCMAIAGEITTAGTTGVPIPIYSTHYEIEYRTTLRAIGSLVFGGAGPRDIVQVHYGSGRASAMGWTGEMSLRKAGALVLRSGFAGSLEANVATLFHDWNLPGKKPKVSMLMGPPAYVLALTSKAEEVGYDFKNAGLESIGTGGDFVSDYFRERMRQTWGCEVFEGYGLVETGPVTATDCHEHRSLHVRSNFGYPEVLDPETGEVVEPGEEGVLALTTFYPAREAMPLLRYWTGDVVVMDDESCPCGVGSDLIKDVRGRLEHRVKVSGKNFYPETIATILQKYPQVATPLRFKVNVNEVREGQVFALTVESSAKLRKKEEKLLVSAIKADIEATAELFKTGAVRAEVDVVAPGAVQDPFPVKHFTQI